MQQGMFPTRYFTFKIGSSGKLCNKRLCSLAGLEIRDRLSDDEFHKKSSATRSSDQMLCLETYFSERPFTLQN